MNFEPTNLAPGSVEKIDLLRRRAESGLPLWHACDRVDYDGLTGVEITTRQRREARGSYEPRRASVISSGRKIQAE